MERVELSALCVVCTSFLWVSFMHRYTSSVSGLLLRAPPLRGFCVHCTAGIQAQTAECLVVGEIAAKDLVVALNKVNNSYHIFSYVIVNQIFMMCVCGGGFTSG
jgi:hypothetical protein